MPSGTEQGSVLRSGSLSALDVPFRSLPFREAAVAKTAETEILLVMVFGYASHDHGEPVPQERYDLIFLGDQLLAEPVRVIHFLRGF